MIASRVSLFLLGHFQTNEGEISNFCLYLKRFGLATGNFDSSLRLMSCICMFVANFEVTNHVTSVLGPENRPESLA